MPIISHSHRLSSFLNSFLAQDKLRTVFSLLLMVLVFLYPGENYFQTIFVPREMSLIPPLSLPNMRPYPLHDGTPAPSVTAYSVFVQDVNSGTVIYAKNPNAELMPASTTKIMTAIIALETFPDLEQNVVIADAENAIGKEMKLQKNEKISIKNLLYGLLIESGNDAAFALASNHPEGYAGFVKAMNEKAATLGLTGTIYRNPSGVEQVGHITTARDLAVLARYAVKIPTISEIMQIKEVTVSDVSGVIRHRLFSTNELLGALEGVKGLKTGWTENAGECLVTYVDRGGNPIVIVILKSEDRFGETESLINWVYNHHTWTVPSI